MIITPILSSLLLALPLSQSVLAAALEGSIEARQDGDVEAQWTWLHFEGCDDKEKADIRKAHQSALDMADHVRRIDFANDHGAMDFFGPSVLRKDWQGNILDVFHHISTFRQSSLPGFRMNARCGRDNDKKYQNKEDAVSNMNFCDQFYLYDALDDAVEKSMNDDDFKLRYNLARYTNQGYIMLHEMMHATVMTYKENKDRRIIDMAMDIFKYKKQQDSRDYRRRKVKRDVYGPENYTQALDWYSRGGAMIVVADNDTFSLNTAALSNDALTTSDNDGNDDAYTLHDVDVEEVVTLDLIEDTIVLATEFSSDFNNELFRWSTYVRIPEPECAKTGSDAPSDRVSFTVDEVEEQIMAFYSDKENYGTVLTTFIDQGTGETRDGARKAMGLDSGVTAGNGVFWIGAYYGGGSWNGNQTWPQGGPWACDTDVRDNKYRGSLTDFGLVYQVIGVGSVDDTKPLGTVPVGENGGLECEDTTDAVYDFIDEPTCTCWFRDLADQSSVFGTPKEEACADIDYRPAWTFFEDPEYRPVREEGKERPVNYRWVDGLGLGILESFKRLFRRRFAAHIPAPSGEDSGA
ncbi:hypothetical protein BDW69DRAFT_183214 [Aspergillus filifer]